MKISKEVPDLPANDYRFMAVIMIDGYGRPRQLENEYRCTIERMLGNEFGKGATLTRLMRTMRDGQTIAEDPLHSDDPVVLTDSSDDPVVEE